MNLSALGAHFATSRKWLALSAALLVAAGSTRAAPQGQGVYLNFESPQVKPVTVGTVEGRRYLFVCNTPDNSVDVFALSRMELASEQVTTSPATLPADPHALDRDRGYAARIPVGLEPVSVTVATIDGVTRLYTANWLSDSVTFVKLTSPAANPNEEDAFAYEIERVVTVGDEPMCVAVMDDGGSNRNLFVTKRTASSYSQLDPVTGAFRDVWDKATNTTRIGGGADVIMTTDGSFANLLKLSPPNEGSFTSPISAPAGVMALKEPHTVVVNGTKAWMLGQQGGGSKLDHDDDGGDTSTGLIGGFNLDLWRIDLTVPTAPAFKMVPALVGGTVPADSSLGTGTTNFNMATAGNWLYVVSTDALNAGVGNPAQLAHSTGFVKTLLCKVDATTGALVSRDLNFELGGPVTKAQSLAHCTDVAVFRGQKVCVVAFNSDRFAIVNTTFTAPGGQQSPGLWQIERTDITATNDDDGSLTGVNVAGPRAIAVALDPAFPTGATTRAGDRVYVLNRLDHSISVIDPNLTPANRQTFGFALPIDPVPDSVRRGQQFLYSAKVGSNSGFVSCASCHIDGRSDQLQWRLSSEDTNLLASIHSPLNIAVQRHEIGGTVACVDDDFDPTDGDGDGFPHELAGDRLTPVPTGGTPGSCTSAQTTTDNGKGPMVTQSLQGLLNFDVASGTSLVTNAPYHWRGDKPDFAAFNEAFVGLQGLPDLNNGNPPGPIGIPSDQMDQFTTFINSIHYPPNNLEPRTREYEGELGEVDHLDVTDPVAQAGTGTRRGMKLFHTMQTGGLLPRSCVQCHFLPEGSNNRLTFIRGQEVDNGNLYPADVKFQPIESAALRGLTQKEARLVIDATVSTTTGTDLRTGDLGMGHDGLEGFTRNDFLTPVLNAIPLGLLRTKLGPNITDINDFVRRIDHGVAPIVGRMLSVKAADVQGGSLIDQTKASLLNDMETEVKVANAGLAVYARIGATERHFWFDLSTAPTAGAIPKYQETPVTGTTLFQAGLLGLPAGASDILVFIATPLGSDLRVASTFGVGETLAGTSTTPSAFSMIETRPNTAYRLIPTLKANLPGTINPGTSNGLGPSPGFDIAGPTPGLFRSLDVLDILQDSILPGPANVNTHDAPRRLRVTAKSLVVGASIKLTVPVGSGSTVKLDLPIYPTQEFAAGDARIWETAVELEPLIVYVLRLGGFDTSNVNVQNILAGAGVEINPAPSPVNYTWEVRNTSSSVLVAVDAFRYTIATP